MVTAASAGVAAITGLIAKDEVTIDDDAHALLVTHRTLNLGLLVLTVVLAAFLMRRPPSAGYFAVGVSGLATLIYSAYLGEKMVHEHGVGVRTTEGLRDDGAPEIALKNVREVMHHVSQAVVLDVADCVVRRDGHPQTGSRTSADANAA